jgi:AcrR family transcriptional regulator
MNSRARVAAPPRRPGGRSARVRAAALDAAIEQLGEGGYAGLTLENVARRAGVHKTTLYRRWGTREALVLEAMLEHARERVPVPDTGSLRGDLLELARSSVATLTSPPGEAIARAVAGQAASDARLADAACRFWDERLVVDGVIVERAIARGELARETDARTVIEAVLGPIYFRVLASGERVDERFCEAVVELAARGASGCASDS